MNTPEWLGPGIWGAVAGAALVGVVGFTWGGWVTGGNASRMAGEQSRASVIAALVPVCVDMARIDPERVARIATIKAASTYQRRDAVMAAGWATVPGATTPDRELAQACLAALDVDAS